MKPAAVLKIEADMGCVSVRVCGAKGFRGGLRA